MAILFQIWKSLYSLNFRNVKIEYFKYHVTFYPLG